MNRTVPSIYKTAIEPCCITIDTAVDNDCSVHILPDTLGSPAYEVVGAYFVAVSREFGYWVAHCYDDRATSESTYAEMLDTGFLYEERMNDFWLYGLSPFAIETIYFRQTERIIHDLITEVQSIRGSLPQHLSSRTALH